MSNIVPPNVAEADLKPNSTKDTIKPKRKAENPTYLLLDIFTDSSNNNIISFLEPEVQYLQ